MMLLCETVEPCGMKPLDDHLQPGAACAHLTEA